MNDKIRTSELYDCTIEWLKDFLYSYAYPWEILPHIKDFISDICKNGLNDFQEIKKGVFAGKNVKIHSTSIIEAPSIIGEGTEIRPGAFIRGSVITGSNCVIGNSTELKNCILLDNVQVPHYNYVGDSILGNHSHMGAGSICSNLRTDGNPVVIKGNRQYETNLRKVGAFLADGADIGCGCVLNPGTIIGKNTSVYPLNSIKGILNEQSIVKNMNEIVAKY